MEPPTRNGIANRSKAESRSSKAAAREFNGWSAGSQPYARIIVWRSSRRAATRRKTSRSPAPGTSTVPTRVAGFLERRHLEDPRGPLARRHLAVKPQEDIESFGSVSSYSVRACVHHSRDYRFIAACQLSNTVTGEEARRHARHGSAQLAGGDEAESRL